MDQKIFEELIAHQQQKLLKLANEIVEGVTEEDLLQPFDYPELENHPHFRYEEGILHGILSSKAALLFKA
jgi:hypothetical protein